MLGFSLSRRFIHIKAASEQHNFDCENCLVSRCFLFGSFTSGEKKDKFRKKIYIANMREIEIRLAKSNEIPRVRYITKLAYKIPYKGSTFATKPHEPKDIRDKLAKKELFIFVAVLDGKIVGAVRCEIRNRNQLYFHKLAVLKTYRKRGIGSMLVNIIEKFAWENGCAKVLLDCVKEKKLDEYYLKFGYKIDNLKKHLDYHEVYMSKELK
jgi:predicted N-acetyltransferase YhbS